MSLTAADVERVAMLARLELNPDEIALFTRQLSAILEYVDQLSAVDTTNVEPMAHAWEISNVFGPDEVRPSLLREEVLSNAPKRDEECYRVPAVLGE